MNPFLCANCHLNKFPKKNLVFVVHWYTITSFRFLGPYSVSPFESSTKYLLLSYRLWIIPPLFLEYRRGVFIKPCSTYPSGLFGEVGKTNRIRKFLVNDVESPFRSLLVTTNTIYHSQKFSGLRFKSLVSHSKRFVSPYGHLKDGKLVTLFLNFLWTSLTLSVSQRSRTHGKFRSFSVLVSSDSLEIDVVPRL